MKYELLEEDTIEIESHKLYRIRALTKFRDDVEPGDLGGYIDKTSTLSHQNECWVDCNSKVYNDVKIDGNVSIVDSEIDNLCRINGDIAICRARLSDDVIIMKNAIILGCKISNKVILDGTLDLSECSISDNVLILSEVDMLNTKLSNYVSITGDYSIMDAHIASNIKMHGKGLVLGVTLECDRNYNDLKLINTANN